MKAPPHSFARSPDINVLALCLLEMASAYDRFSVKLHTVISLDKQYPLLLVITGILCSNSVIIMTDIPTQILIS